MIKAKYGWRSCSDHYHLYVGQFDLQGGECSTEEEAQDKAELLNMGVDPDEVLGSPDTVLIIDDPFTPGTVDEAAVMKWFSRFGN